MRNWAVAQYDSFARFYDAVNGEPEELISQILEYVERFGGEVRTVLELGCGTGAVLAGLGSGLSLTGIDVSESMLAYARRRCPGARLLSGDITSFDLGETFDLVVCVFDTLNHVTTFEGWRAVFANVAAHLKPGGLFIFDLHTLGRLRDLGTAGAWVYDFDANTLIMNVDFTGEPLAVWDIRIFENAGEQAYRLHHETIVELAVSLDVVRDALAENFIILDETDTEGSCPSDDSPRAMFATRRR